MAGGVALAATAGWITGIGQDALSAVGAGIGSWVRPESVLRITTNVDHDRFQSLSLDLPSYVIPLPAGQFDAPPSQDRPIGERDAWAASLGGVQASMMDIQVIVTGNADQLVLLTNLRINVLERRPPAEVARGEHEAFYLSVTTDTCDCLWNAELFYSAGDQEGSGHHR
ncbi:MAG: hypothetical protein ACRD0K_05800 [Egibacteraceae bacterium]